MKKARKTAVIVLVTLSFAILIGVGAFIAFMLDGVSLDESKLPIAEATLTVFDGSDEVIHCSGYTKLSDISPNIRNAFIAVEDKRFYSHNGLDLYRIAGALIHDIKNRELSQGGSTISNQLVKNTQLSSEKTLRRKMQEAKITLELERKYTKDEILEMYLNVIYFGKGLYGVNEACRYLYAKAPSDISPAEAASLAATVANPSAYSILINRDKNLDRTRMILSLMQQQKYLSQQEYEGALREDIAINYDNFNNNYNRIYIKSTLSEAKAILKDLYKTDSLKGCRIYTYYDEEKQKVALSALSAYGDAAPSDYSKELVIADNASCGILAYASNSALSFDLQRQPGSLLKPFIYAKAIENGELLPDTPLLDAPTDHDGYSPTNYGNVSYGWISANDALAQSLNTVAVDLLDKIGIEQGYQAITDVGIDLCARDRHLSLALGGITYGSTTKQLIEGYLTLANQGIHKKAGFIRKIVDKNGKTIYDGISSEKHVLSKESAYLTTRMLLSAAKSGTAKQLRSLPFDVAAKTGTVATAQGNSDALCACYTTQHTLVCRYSATSSPFDNSVTGGNLPTKTLRAAMREIYSSDSPEAFQPPARLKKVDIDKTIKDTFHKLVPYKSRGYGERETILGTYNYTFDAPDPERLLLGDIRVSLSEDAAIISFDRFEGITYDVYLNGVQCSDIYGEFYAQEQAFPIGKLEIYCKKRERTLWKMTRLVPLY